MAHHSRYTVTVSATVAMRSCTNCISMEDHCRKSLINVFLNIDVESLKLIGGLISPTVNDQCYCVHGRSPIYEEGLGLTGSTLHYMCQCSY